LGRDQAEQRCNITLRPKASNQTNHNRRTQGFTPYGFAAEDIAQVNFSTRYIQTLDAICQRQGSMGPGTRIDHNPIPTGVQSLKKDPFVIALKKMQFHRRHLGNGGDFGPTGFNFTIHLIKRLCAINIRFARSKQIQVDAVGDQNAQCRFGDHLNSQ